MKPSELLTVLLKLFEDPSRWTQGYYAYDINRRTVSPFDVSAACFCLIGGCAKVRPLGQPEVSQEAKTYLSRALRARVGFSNDRGLVDFNDASGRKVEEVRDLIEDARFLALSDGV